MTSSTAPDFWALIVGVVLVAAGLVVWRVKSPATFERHVAARVRAWRRASMVYRPRWVDAMAAVGLVARRGRVERVPRLVRVRSDRWFDRVEVEMLPGQTVGDFAAVGERLAQTFGRLGCRCWAVSGRPHRAELRMLVSDPLTTVVPQHGSDVDALWSGLALASREDGSEWRLALRGSHVLIVGVTGAGKSAVIWAIVAALTPAVRADLVELWVLDPKGGMELSAGQPLFARWCCGDGDGGHEVAFAELLESAVEVMRRRQPRLRGVTRLHEPSTDEPLIVLIVDELAALTAWTVDRNAKRRIDAALGLLLSQGRAVGVVVVGAVQDPRKETLPMRDLFPVRIALRLHEPEQVVMTLGPGTRARGATCDTIPPSLPGVGYVMVDGQPEPVRVRFAHVTDRAIAELAGDASDTGDAKSDAA